TGSDPDGTVTSYSWAFPGGSPSSSNLANPGSVIYSAAGTFSASLVVTDNAGLTDPSPPARTITLPDFSLQVGTGSQTVLPGGSTTYSATVIPGTAFAGNVTFSVSGLPTGATASFSPPSVSTSGSTIMTVSTTGATPPGDYSLTLIGTGTTL